MPAPKVTAIIWDFGNILGIVDHHKACARLANFSALPADYIYNTLFIGENALEKSHEAGFISSPDFFDAVKKVARIKRLSYEEFCEIWGDIFAENQGIDAVLRRIPERIKMCVLSNTDPIHWSFIAELPVMRKHFGDPRKLIRSYAVGACKPDKKMYEDALSCLRVDTQNLSGVLYVEDVQEYCDAFNRMGGRSIRYDCSEGQPPEILENIFDSLGVFQD